jgi:hypothetical protein
MTQERSRGRRQRASERRATTTVREWLRDRIDPAERGTTAQITEVGVAWLRQDEELLDNFLYEHLFAVVAEMVRAEMQATRRVRRMKEAIEETEEQARARLQQWFDRREHVSPEIGYVRLGALTMDDLEVGALEREQRVRRDATGARWFRILRSGMAPGQTVEEVYTALQVEQAYDSARATVAARMEDIMAGAQEALDRILNPTADDGRQQSPRPNGSKPSK